MQSDRSPPHARRQTGGRWTQTSRKSVTVKAKACLLTRHIYQNASHDSGLSLFSVSCYVISVITCYPVCVCVCRNSGHGWRRSGAGLWRRSSMSTCRSSSWWSSYTPVNMSTPPLLSLHAAQVLHLKATENKQSLTSLFAVSVHVRTKDVLV